MPDYDHSQKTELFEPRNAEQYLLYSKPEIVRVLRDLAKRPEIITAYFDGGYFLTAVLGVLPDRDMVVLDYGPDEQLNARALQSDRVVCVTRQDHVSVRFTCTHLHPAKYQGRAALAAPLPESVYRPQRREFFRVATPTYNPLRLRIPRGFGDPLELPLVDLSCGGVSVYDFAEELEVNPGQIVEGCGLELPGFGRFVCDMEVRNLQRVRMNDGSEAKRVGLQFRALAIDSNALVQRYLHKLQMEAKR